MTNPVRFSTGLVLPFTHKGTNPKLKLPGSVMSPEILNPEFKVGTLNPKTFESGEFCLVNDFFLESSLESGYFSACDLFSLR